MCRASVVTENYDISSKVVGARPCVVTVCEKRSGRMGKAVTGHVSSSGQCFNEAIGEYVKHSGQEFINRI